MNYLPQNTQIYVLIPILLAKRPNKSTQTRSSQHSTPFVPRSYSLRILFVLRLCPVLYTKGNEKVEMLFFGAE